jgi:hypothetical protein
VIDAVSASRVSEVRLQLRVPAELRDSARQLQTAVERGVIQSVLDELERLLHERFGSHVVIRIRHLSLRWRPSAGELASVAEVSRLARDLAAHVIAEVLALPAASRLRPRDPAIALFASERHADVAFLADAADGLERCWVHARSDVAATWHDIVAAGIDSIRETLRWLREMDRVEAVLAAAPAEVWSAVEVAVPVVAPAIALLRARVDAATAARGNQATAATAAAGAAPSRVTSSEPIAAATIASPRATESTHAVEHAAPAPGEVTQPDGENAAAHVRGPDTDAVPPHPTSIVPPSQAAPASTTPVIEGGSAPATLDAGSPDASLVLETRAAGLFYLAGRVLEIDLAERLWAAGLPEGDVLGWIACTILGHTDDPAWAWFGGAFHRAPAIPAVEDWAAGEIAEVVQHALGRRLVRFGVTTSPAALGAQLDRLAAVLPPPVELPALLSRVVSRNAAALAVITGARLGREPDIAELRAICMRPGRLALVPDALHVIMPATAVDIDHRRAGLDHDPGHVPWLGRALRFELAGAEVM